LNIKPGNTEFDDIKIKFSLTTGIKDDNGVPRIFVTPSSNKIIVSDISGSDISDYVKSIKTKRKNYSVNMSFGYGVIFGGNKQLLYGPSMQIGIGYNIINF
jgi:hypothetical protein